MTRGACSFHICGGSPIRGISTSYLALNDDLEICEDCLVTLDYMLGFGLLEVVGEYGKVLWAKGVIFGGHVPPFWWKESPA